ncbi:MAG: cytidine deaminase [Erysipelotrichaceae bacterium]|nr:cytidine deaminase [Erysipelotrichaceae bacterium]
MEKIYNKAKEQYHPKEVSPFIYAHHVVCAIESENGEIYAGFCIESCGGVLDLCAERTAALNMYINSGQTVIKRLIAFRDQAPSKESCGMPCGACKEFLMQFNQKNKDMEIMVDYEKREVITLEKLLPDWWGLVAMINKKLRIFTNTKFFSLVHLWLSSNNWFRFFNFSNTSFCCDK